ncbi:MAG: hypothetical protein GVY30_01025 [Chloroflexi bacterium]|nr:hypothetical protein [Chloroflexota bacterium]
MPFYRITKRDTGVHLGDYPGDTPLEAIGEMARAANSSEALDIRSATNLDIIPLPEQQFIEF